MALKFWTCYAIGEMRLCLPCLGCSSSERSPKDQDSDHSDIGVLRSLIGFMKPCSFHWTQKNCKWKTEQNEYQYHQLEVVKRGTLEELLFADSSGKSDDGIFRQFFKRICPPFPENRTANKASDQSVSLERLLMVEEVTHSGENIVVSSMSRSRSVKVRKRVSFRFPSEADIIIIYSSDVESDDQD